MIFKIAFVAALVAPCAWGYSSGAPVAVCDDMTPKHPFEPQTTPLPYQVAIGKKTLKIGEETKITISGKDFKGFLVQVRNSADKAAGSLSGGGDGTKFIECHGAPTGAATHSEATPRKSVQLTWKAPTKKGQYNVYVTVATDGETFWAKKNVGKISVV